MNTPLELTVIMYHYVRDPGDAAEAGSGIPGMPVKTFEMQLDELSKQHTYVNWTDVRTALGQGRPLPSSACLLTFDDGVTDHYLNAFQVLRRWNLSGLFFIMDRSEGEGFILAHKIHFLLAKLGLGGLRDAIWEQLNAMQRETFTKAEMRYKVKYPPISLDNGINLLKSILQRDLSKDANPILSELFKTQVGPEREMAQDYYLNPEQIREMSAGGMHLGGHSRSHPWFDWIDAEARAKEIKASADWIGQFESGPWAFAYPYGGLSEDSPALLKEHGFIAAFTTQAQVRHSNPYFIGRLDGEELVQDGYIHA